jgi:enterochelin esterase family protein
MSALMAKWFSQIFFLILLLSSVYTQAATLPPNSDRQKITSLSIESLKKEVASGNAAALAKFWKQIEEHHTPLVEEDKDQPGNSIVTFLYRANPEVQNVRLESNLNVLLSDQLAPDLDRLGFMSRLEGTDVWYLSVRVRNDVRCTYQFSPNDPAGFQDNIKREQKLQLDSFNPKVFAKGINGQEASVLELKDAALQPWIKENPSVQKGTWDALKFDSKALKNERSVWVYKPANYDPQRREGYSFVICLGGFEFGKLIPTDTILDNLIAAGKIEPTLAVLIDNVEASDEKNSYSSTEQFLVGELLSWLHNKYNLSSDPAKVILTGTSRRGLVAALIAMRQPHQIGNVLSLSGSFFWRPDEKSEYEWVATQFSRLPKLPLNFYLATGLLETAITPRNMGHYMLATNRHLRNVLQAKGYKVTLTEFNGVHDDLNWQGYFAEGLVHLAGKKPDKQ